MRKAELVEALMELGHSKEDLKGMKKDELEEMYENETDTTWAHPNESWEDFMEHECFD